MASARTLEKAGFQLVRRRRHIDTGKSGVVCLDYELDAHRRLDEMTAASDS